MVTGWLKTADQAERDEESAHAAREFHAAQLRSSMRTGATTRMAAKNPLLFLAGSALLSRPKFAMAALAAFEDELSEIAESSRGQY